MGSAPEGAYVLPSDPDGDFAATPEANMLVQSQTTTMSNNTIQQSVLNDDDDAFQVLQKRCSSSPKR